MHTEGNRIAAGKARTVGLVAMDLLVVAGVWAAADRLSDWGWSVRGLAVLAAGWGLVLAVAAWLHCRQPRRALFFEVTAGLAVLALVGWQYPPLKAGWGSTAYGFAAVAVALGGWRCWRRKWRGAEQDDLAEPLRVLLLAGVAAYVMLPLFTHRHLGGIDARWYAFMLHDFIEQWRSHGPPVFVGQGEYVWNGAIHLFRSAPVYMHVAGLWDWLTWGGLTTPALQHLTAITATFAASWGAYAASVKIAPKRRWEGAALAALYVMSPAILMPLYASDAYMTYVASAAFVWVAFGNIRILTEGRGWTVLAASLSLAWMCHPPTAMQVTLISAVLQTGGLAFGEGGWTGWRKAIGAAVLFGLLSLFYFVGMSELPDSAGEGIPVSVLQIVAFAAGCFFGGRAVVARRIDGGVFWLLPAGAVLWLTCRPWVAWLVVTLVLAWAISAIASHFWRRDPLTLGPLWVLIAALAGAAGMDFALRAGWFHGVAYPDHSHQLWSVAWSNNILSPLSPTLSVAGDFQPGWGLWLAGLAAGLVAFRREARAAQLVFGATVLMSCLVLPWPRVAEFALDFLPMKLVELTGITMDLRVHPVFAGLLLGGGWLAIRAGQVCDCRRFRWAVGSLLVLAVGWAAWQAQYFVQRGYAITASVALETKDWRTENAPMDRYVFDLLPLPSYFSHGKMDPNLEVRLLDDHGGLLYGPAQMVAAMEAAGSETHHLVTRAIPGHPRWHQLEPGFVLQPGERRLLRFEFDPASRYDGYIVFVSTYGYREYILPESGMTRSFGTGPNHSRVLSFWNSGSEAEHYQIQFKLGPGHALEPDMRFAQLTTSEWRPELSRIRLVSLNPWKVETDLPSGGKLETPRVYLPGYEVKVDGCRIDPEWISPSPDRLLQIVLPPGEHQVEVRYVGTWKVKVAGLISLIAWVVVLGHFALGGRRRAI